MSNFDIAREVMTDLASRITKERGSSKWKWANQTVVFPDLRCPFCSDVLRSNAVWVIKGESTLLGQAIPTAGRVFKLTTPNHPHVKADTGAICFGNAQSAVHALFSSLNPESVYTNVIGWLQSSYWNHDCKQLPGRVYCYGCENSIDEDDDYTFEDEHYCYECFSDRAFNCYWCGSDRPRDDEHVVQEHSYCLRCFQRDCFKCTECEETFNTNQRPDPSVLRCMGCSVVTITEPRS